MSKVKITKTIVREIQTKKFEQVTITVGREEEVEFKSDEEKSKKVTAFTQDLLADFSNTYNEVCSVLGVQRCIGVVEVDKPVDSPSSPSDDGDKDGLLDF